MHTIVVALLASSLSSTPSISVAVVRRVGLDGPAGINLAEQFMQSLKRQKKAQLAARWVSPRAFAASLAAANNPDSAECAGATDCAAVLGKIGNVEWLFAVQIVKVATDVVLDVSVVRVADGSVAASANTTAPFKRPVPALDLLAGDLMSRAVPVITSPPPLPTPEVAKSETPPPPPPPPPNSASSSSTETASSTSAKPSEGGETAGEVSAAAAPASTGHSGLLAGGLAVGDILGKTFGAEVYAGYHINALDLALHLRLGSFVGVGVSGAYVIDLGRVLPFVELRADAYPSGPAFGGGLEVGTRIGIAGGFSLVVEVGAEAWGGNARFKNFGLVASGGIDWRI